MRILLCNSDLAKNRGDRAIAEGIIALIRTRFPGAHVTGISEFASRDARWFGIDFLAADVHSLNPLQWLKLLVAARQSDLVLWGGGEFLKDYTNRAALYYWALKIGLIRIVNRNVLGAFQGIGPTRTVSSRRLIAWAANQTKVFITRDEESARTLAAWGAGIPLIPSSDPALLPEPEGLGFTEADLEVLSEAGVDPSWVKDYVGIAPRKWFHYSPNSLVPFRYKTRARRLLRLPETASPSFRLYRERLLSIIDDETQAGRRVILIPMHLGRGEADVVLCRDLRQRCADPESVFVLDCDIISPALLRKIIGQARHFIGFRLHSTILATAASVPSLNYYYVDKGRQYFEQIRMQEWSAPIEALLADDFLAAHRRKVADLEARRSEIQSQLSARVHLLRQSIQRSFEEAMHAAALE